MEVSSVGIHLYQYGVSKRFRRKFVQTRPNIYNQAPAKDAVKYKTVTSIGYFFNRSPYLGTHVDKLDSMWKDLYDCKRPLEMLIFLLEANLVEVGTSAISPTEASKLPNATLPTPKDNSTYLVELGVFHHLHCLNMIRKAAYPDQYPEMWVYHGNGTVNHNALPSFHLGILDSRYISNG